MTVIINEEFSFGSNTHQSIENVKEALDKYSENYSRAKNLESKIPIFIDANVLLNYYGMSSSEKAKLVDFIKKNVGLITITKQIEIEFIRNRVSVINDYFSSLEQLKSVIEKDLIKDITGKFKSVLNNKILKEDYNKFWNIIDGQFDKLKAELFNESVLKTDFDAAIDKEVSVNKHLKIKDDVLEVFQNITVTDSLEGKEIQFLKNDFKRLLSTYNEANATSKWKFAFPGCGEKKAVDKADGDFIIYHEILKYMKSNKSDAIFLTNDITKEDWISKSGDPFIHYIEKTYLNSGQNLYIFEAKRLLEDISFENIYDKENESKFIVLSSGDLKLECNSCLELNYIDSEDIHISFDVIHSEPKKMGYEYHHKAVQYYDCHNCKHELMVDFDLFEYPSGVANFTRVQSEDSKVLIRPNLLLF